MVGGFFMVIIRNRPDIPVTPFQKGEVIYGRLRLYHCISFDNIGYFGLKRLTLSY